MMKRWLLAAATVVACGTSLAAQDQGVATLLTLEDAISRALATSHRIAEGTARREGATAAIAVRRAAAKPTVALSGGYTRTNHVDEFGIPQSNGVLRVIYPDVPDN